MGGDRLVNERRRAYKLGGLALASLVLAWLLASSAFSVQSNSSIWVAESRGILTLDQTNGSVLSEIPVVPDAQSLTVDIQHKLLWVFSSQNLQSFDFSGNQVSSTLIKPPVGNPSLLLVDTQASRVWLAVQTQLLLFDATGKVLSQIRLANPVIGITLDRTKSQLWAASNGVLTIYDAQGSTVGQVNTSDLKVLRALDYDFKANQIWVAADDTLRRYNPDGTLVFKAQNSFFSGVAFVTADQNGGVWLTNTKQLVHLNSAAGTDFTLAPYAGQSQPSSIVSLIADFVSHSAWVASQQHVTHYALDGTLLGDFVPSLPDGKTRLIRQLALPALPPPPKIQIVAPANNVYLKNPSPAFSLTYSGDFIDLNSIKLTDNGVPLSANCSVQATSASCSVTQPFADGAYDIVATIANTFGEVSQPALAHITIDTIPPKITITSPTNNFLTNQKSLQITGSVDETSTVTINGAPATLSGPSGNQFSFGPVTLTEGTNTFQIAATDLAGNVGTATLSGTLDTIPPTAPAANQIKTSVAMGQITVNGLAGSVEGNSRVTIIDSTAGTQVMVTANADGSFSATLSGSGGDSLQIFATDAAGNQGASISVTAFGGPFSGAIRVGSIAPADGTTVNGDLVLIEVDLQAPPNTGVTIGGVIAAPVSGPTGLRYFANVPLQTGQNTIAISVSAQDGRVVTQSLTINSTGPFQYRIVADRPSGVSPLKVQFKVLDQFALGIQQIQVDFVNSGTVNFTTTNPSAPIPTIYSGIGVQQARFIVVDNAGMAHTQLVPVFLIDSSAVDQSIQAIWGAMNAALASGDKNTALQFLSVQAQTNYSPVFDALLPQMSQIVGSYSNLQQSSVTGSYAEYGVNRLVAGVNRVFLIDYVLNELGQWRLDSM